jgi:hypothetical protein
MLTSFAGIISTSALISLSSAQNLTQALDKNKSIKDDRAGEHKVFVIDQPEGVYYKTRIVRVPNTSKYAPVKNMAVHKQAPPAIPMKPIPFLTAEIGAINENDDHDICPGLSASATQLVNGSSLGKVKTAFISGRVFRNFVSASNNNKIAATGVLVIKGKWDHAERVLESAGIPLLLLGSNKLVDKLAKAKVVVVNCPGEMTETTLQSLRSFVINGGYLLTTDWSLSNCLAPLFHPFVTWDGSYTPSEIVDAIAVEPDNSLFRAAVNQAPWQLDDKSEIAKIVSASNVRVLVRSNMLSKQDSCNLGVLALTFNFGKGRVMHLVGHFNNNTYLGSQSALPDPAPKIQMGLRQALALNFVLEGLSD